MGKQRISATTHTPYWERPVNTKNLVGIPFINQSCEVYVKLKSRKKCTSLFKNNSSIFFWNYTKHKSTIIDLNKRSPLINNNQKQIKSTQTAVLHLPQAATKRARSSDQSKWHGNVLTCTQCEAPGAKSRNLNRAITGGGQGPARSKRLWLARHNKKNGSRAARDL